jgi:hypothetical protein
MKHRLTQVLFFSERFKQQQGRNQKAVRLNVDDANDIDSNSEIGNSKCPRQHL